MKSKLIRLVNKLGYEIKKFPNLEQRKRIKLLQYNNINSVIDIGANIGQYANELRTIGYNKRIVSFEPLEEAYNILKNNASKDELWEVKNFALGDEDGITTINISKSSASSSILDMNYSHIGNIIEKIHYVNTQEIVVKKLDTIFKDSFDPIKENIFLKIDAQGYENKILDGFKENIQYIKGVQIEMSIKELYKGEILFIEMLKKLQILGFEIRGIEPGFYNLETMELLQFDGIFYRN